MGNASRRAKTGQQQPAPAPRRNVPPASSNAAVPTMAVQTRWFDQLIPNTVTMATATNANESQLGVGSRYDNLGLDYSLRNFIKGSSGIYTTYDQYKFKRLVVMAFWLSCCHRRTNTCNMLCWLRWRRSCWLGYYVSTHQHQNGRLKSLQTAGYACLMGTTWKLCHLWNGFTKQYDPKPQCLVGSC